MAHIADPLPAGPTTDAQVSALEAYIGHKLPEDYRRFLLEYNGGRPEPDAFLLNTGNGDEEDIVMCFFPMRDLKLGHVNVENFEELRTWPLHCGWDDLQSDLENLYAEAGIEEPLLPTGTDGSSNYFCIVLAGTRRGAVVFLDHETGETHPLADNFDAFLGSFRERERTDYYAFGGEPREVDTTREDWELGHLRRLRSMQRLGNMLLHSQGAGQSDRVCAVQRFRQMWCVSGFRQSSPLIVE